MPASNYKSYSDLGAKQRRRRLKKYYINDIKKFVQTSVACNQLLKNDNCKNRDPHQSNIISPNLHNTEFHDNSIPNVPQNYGRYNEQNLAVGNIIISNVQANGEENKCPSEEHFVNSVDNDGTSLNFSNDSDYDDDDSDDKYCG